MRFLVAFVLVVFAVAAIEAVGVPANRKKKYDPIPAGCSMGSARGDNHYWSLGTPACDLTTGTAYGITNGHNRLNQAGRGLLPVSTPVQQPSQGGGDEAGRKVGEWVDPGSEDYPDDLAIIKFDDPTKVANKVLGKGETMYTIDGIVTDEELGALAANTVIYYSGRMCGWCAVKFLKYDVSEFGGPTHGKFPQVSVANEADAENPDLFTAGNSGGGFWKLSGDKVKLIGIYSGDPTSIVSAERALKYAKPGGKTLTVGACPAALSGNSGSSSHSGSSSGSSSGSKGKTQQSLKPF